MGTKESASSGCLTEQQRRDRQRNIQLHIQLIVHAAKCDSKTCKSTNCAKMKGFLQHCKNPVCTVPNCLSIRERFRQLAKQQQAMDDRRRLEMNRAYRGGSSSAAEARWTRTLDPNPHTSILPSLVCIELLSLF